MVSNLDGLCGSWLRCQSIRCGFAVFISVEDISIIFFFQLVFLQGIETAWMDAIVAFGCASEWDE